MDKLDTGRVAVGYWKKMYYEEEVFIGNVFKKLLHMCESYTLNIHLPSYSDTVYGNNEYIPELCYGMGRNVHIN